MSYLITIYNPCFHEQQSLKLANGNLHDVRNCNIQELLLL